MLLLLHKTLKGSRNIQGFALIRAVLFIFPSVSGIDLKFSQKNVSTYSESFFWSFLAPFFPESNVVHSLSVVSKTCYFFHALFSNVIVLLAEKLTDKLNNFIKQFFLVTNIKLSELLLMQLLSG